MSVVQQGFARVRGSALARNTGWMFVGLGANSLLQAVAFLLLVRLLGVQQFGQFAGIFALVSTVTPYSSLGSQMVFMRYVSADRDSAPVYWGNMMAITLATTLLVTPILTLIGRSLFGPGCFALILVLVIANCFMSQVTNNASIVFQTFEQLKGTAWLRAFSNLARFLCLGALFLFFRHCSALAGAIAILISSSVAAVIGFFWAQRIVGGMKFGRSLLIRRFGEGIGFSVAGSTQAVYNDVDKMMLGHYGMTVANGIYSFAYRVVDLATIPVNAVDSACLPRYFALNNESCARVLRLARRAIPLAALSGALSALCTLFVFPLILRVAGHGFSDSLLAFRWLCWLPALRGIHQLTGGVLTATGLQNYRTGAQIFVAVLNVCLNILWIPSHGWLGAAWSSLISDGALGLLTFLLIAILMPRNTFQVAPAGTAE